MLKATPEMERAFIDAIGPETYVSDTPFGDTGNWVIDGDVNIIACLNAALAASPAPAVPVEPVVKVKPLEWRDGYRDHRCTIVQAGSLPFYQIRKLDGLIWLDVDNHQTIYPTVEEAKAAAQADYETRIRSALVVTPPAPAVGDGLDGNRPLPFSRDVLGRFVREAWVRWAEQQTDPKPSWLVPYDDLSEPDKEADRQIGEAVARWVLIGDSASRALVGDGWTVEDVREQKLATVVAPDNGSTEEVLAAVLQCAEAWVPEARIMGNVRAGDIARAVRAMLAAFPATDLREENERLQSQLDRTIVKFADAQARATTAEEQLEKAREENKRLRETLADLMSWFPDDPSEPEWRIKAGRYGADDAIEAARAALKAQEQSHDR